MNKPVAYWDGKHYASKDKSSLADIPLYTQEQIEEARKLGMQQERALWNLSESTQEFESFDRTASHMAGEYVAHPVKEQDGCGNCYACLVNVTENGLPVTSQRMILCPDCGNKRCPKASNHRHQCTNSNEPNQRGSIYTHLVKELNVPDGLIDPKSYYIGYEDGKKKSQADIEYEADKAYWRNRTLTDEEILSCLNHLEISESGKKHQIDFARAILRKAQEK